jgi:thiol-disulfide isomerase/thioredoxin
LLVATSAMGKLIGAEGIRFFEGSWEETLKEAKRLDRIIFVDAYAVWCGPCKKMAAEVFTDLKVGEFYNKNFVNLKLDAEKGEGLKFQEKYPISAFPTLFFIDYNGEIVQQVRGAQTVEAFLELGKKALGKLDRSSQFASDYEAGNRSPELILNYIRALNKAGKPSLKIANEYLRSQKDLQTAFNLQFILEATVESDSRIFDLLIQNRSAIEALENPQVVKDRIQQAIEASAQKAISYRNRELLNESYTKMKKYLPEKAASFELVQELEFWSAMGDADKYIAACYTYAKKEISKDAKALSGLSGAVISQFGHLPKAIAAAEEFAKSAAGVSKDFRIHLKYAGLLDRNGKKDKALEVAQKALELSKSEGNNAVRSVEMFIQQLKNK